MEACANVCTIPATEGKKSGGVCQYSSVCVFLPSLM